jgi:predicted CXXCH cytochrome family protein
MKTAAPKLLAWLVAAVWLLAFSARADSIVNSPHNLSANGPGAVKAATQTNLCSFCHTVHHANGATPLWNHALSSVTNYITYSSGTLQAIVGQPDGASRLCLSCHDGTVALGMIGGRSLPVQMQNGVTFMPSGADNLGTDLSKVHPFSFRYDAALVHLDPSLKDPTQLNGAVKLDRNSEMQCTSCHDPHNDQFGNFLVQANTASALCLNCHAPGGWSGSGHGLSNVELTPPVQQAMARAVATPAPPKAAKSQTVASGGCENCHAPHFAGSRERLMKFARPEDNCFSCHRANGTGADLTADFAKISVHPISINSDTHDPRENPVNPPKRHVTCADCHNAHAATSAVGNSRKLSGALFGVAGVTAGGAVIKTVSSEIELCFRCHADSIARGPSLVPRRTPQTNKRLQFSAGNLSFHPLEAVGKNPRVPSLIAPWTTASVMTCTGCHNSDQSPAAGGKGASGPHGSAFAPLLERQLVLTDFSAESAANYALCYKCHSRDSILADQSFHATSPSGVESGHRFHIVDQRAACATCHDSHGVAASSRLINFNVNYVTAASNGRLQFTAGTYGPSSGTCTLKCHGYDHLSAPYGPLGMTSLRNLKPFRR